MKKIALITGATSGIGKATAKLIAPKYRLIITGRRKDRLEELQKELSTETDVHTLCFDAGKREESLNAIENLPTEWKEIEVLINNAGNAHGLAPIHEGNLDDWEAMIDINLKGVMYMSRAITPGMVKRKSGHVVNISSVAGIEAYANGNLYNASKFAVDGLSKAMRFDLNPYGVKVTDIKPGMVETEFSMVRFKGDEEKANKVYEGMTPLKAQDIAEVVEFVINRPAHVKIADVLILATDQASATVANRKK
ncbi:unnamed protein product [Chrysoparadoxa australica]